MVPAGLLEAEIVTAAPETKKLSILLGCDGMVAFKVGHHATYPEHKEFECHDVISSQLQERVGQSRIRVLGHAQ